MRKPPLATRLSECYRLVARKTDVFPAERREVLEQARIDGLGFPKQSDGALEIDRVQQRRGQAGGAGRCDRRRGTSDQDAATHRGDQRAVREGHGRPDSGRPERPGGIEGTL